MTFYMVLSLSAFLISLLGTRLLILALRKRTVLIDIPNARSNHQRPTPKGGGLAVVTALVICLLVADMGIDYDIILSLLILTAVSLLDDIIGVPVSVRLVVQAIAVGLPLGTMPVMLSDGLLPDWAEQGGIFLLWLWFMNLFNFMDGIDGIAAVEMLCIAAGLCLLVSLIGVFPDRLSVYGLITAAAACGFLWWNWHPARIFLGDVGSIPIGFLLGYLLLLAAHNGYGYAALILPAYYLADGGLTLFKRLMRGEKIWVAHSEHYYQKAVRNGRSHDAVARYVFGINLLLILLAVFSALHPNLAMFYAALAYFSVFMLLGFFAHSHPKGHGHA